MEENELYEKAIKTWGADIQVLMLIEEMSELTKALIKYFRNSTVDNMMNIAEETADVEIMIAQLKVIFKGHYLDSFVQSVKEGKLARLENILETWPKEIDVES